MDIKQEAHEYALKALESELEKIEQAYIEGYKACKRDSHETVIDEKGIEWVDLSLPSGTLWSKPLKKGGVNLFMTYNQAKNLDIPTVDDIREILSSTDITRHGSNAVYTEVLSIDGVSYTHGCQIWIKSEADSKMHVKCCDSHFGICDAFMGLKKSIVLVKHKDNK